MDSQNHQFLTSLQEQWLCPISRNQMHDPVITSDGHTYQRQAIEHHLKSQIKSPLTNLPLQNKNLIPNIAFKNLIEKLYAEMPVFLDKQIGLECQVEQLKQQIAYLKDQLLHEKQKNQELIEKQEKQFKTKRIEKHRHQIKNDQLKVIRQQKNHFQKQLQQLRSKEQQQSRQIRLLKQQLAKFTDRYDKASRKQRHYTELYQKVDRNRYQILRKLQSSFNSNFTFICHLLHSIEQAKKYEAQVERLKASQQTIQFEQNLQNFNLNKKITEKLQQIIKETLNKVERQQDEQHSRILQRHYRRLAEIRNPIFRRRLNGSNATENYRNAINIQILSRQQSINSQSQNLQQNIQQNHQQGSLNNIPQPNRMQEQRNQFGGSINHLPNVEDSSMYKQLQSIKWMMAKRNYRQIEEFYNYKSVRRHNDAQVYWYGVHLSVLQSHIPFKEYLGYSWNHLRMLDISSCHIDDSLWKRFIESSGNFKNLMEINANRNNIETIQKSDLQKFVHLVKFRVRRNKLNKTTTEMIAAFILQNPTIQIQYNQIMEGQNGSFVQMADWL